MHRIAHGSQFCFVEANCVLNITPFFLSLASLTSYSKNHNGRNLSNISIRCQHTHLSLLIFLANNLGKNNHLNWNNIYKEPNQTLFLFYQFHKKIVIKLMLTPSDKKEHLHFVLLGLYFLKPMNLKPKIHLRPQKNPGTLGKERKEISLFPKPYVQV